MGFKSEVGVGGLRGELKVLKFSDHGKGTFLQKPLTD